MSASNLKTVFKTTLVTTALAAGLITGAVADEKHVAITQIVEHPALDAVTQGVKDVLAENGLEEGKNLKWSFESAQGNPTVAGQIAKKFVGAGPDVIVAIATPSAQAVAANTRDIPIVFSAVTDPLGAKLVKDMNKPGANITGMTDLSPINKHVALIKEIAPDAKSLGILFNPGEANSVTLVELVKQHAPEHGLSVVEGAAPRSSDVLGAARSLVGKVDALYVPTDNTIVSAFEAVAKVAGEADLPLIAGDTSSVERGAIAAIGFNYYDIGRQTGGMVLKVLSGTNPGDMAVEGVETVELFVNKTAAAEQGVTLSDDLVARAKKVIE